MRLTLLAGCLSALFTLPAAHAAKDVRLEVLGSYAAGAFDEGAAEIVAHDPATQRLFVVNGATGGIDVLSIADPHAPTKLFGIDLSGFGRGANSVAVKHGVVAVAVEAHIKTDNGHAVFFAANCAEPCAALASVEVGALPDMLTFSPDGRYVLVANEGEPNDDYSVDPEGSVSIVDLKRGVKRLRQSDVATADFRAFNTADLDPAIRLSGHAGSTPAQDFEPEYIAVDRAGRRAFVTLQEANTLAVVDIRSATVERLIPLGSKDHSLPGNGFDASNQDGAINIRPWPVEGLFMPDTIAHFTVRGREYYITANEGDTRDYDGFADFARLRSLTLDPTAFPDLATLRDNANLGRLNISTVGAADPDGDGDIDRIQAFGGRSFSIYDASGKRLYDSGDTIERIVAEQLPAHFNANNDDNDSFDSRSDDKGPEPEGVAVGNVRGVPYAFVGLERVGGVMVFDLSEPTAPRFVQYLNYRDFSQDATSAAALDLGPEGLTFIAAEDSPTGDALLAVGNEISGTTTLYRIAPVKTGRD